MAILKALSLLSLLPLGGLAIWPLPVSQSTGNDVLWIDQNVPVYYNGESAVSRPKFHWISRLMPPAGQRTITIMLKSDRFKCYCTNSRYAVQQEHLSMEVLP